MKSLKFLILVSFFPLMALSQDLSGIWTGVLSNDSLTIRKNQTFEIALTEYKGKVYGYTYSTFIVNDTLFYIIKKVKGDVNGKICEVKDVEIVTHNFQRKPEKGVNVVYTFRKNQQENKWTIDGNWKTNATKNFYSLSGDVNAREEKDLSMSRLYQHLGDLNLQQTLVLNKTKEIKPGNKILKETPVKEPIARSTVKSGFKKPENDMAKQDVKKDNNREDQISIIKKTADQNNEVSTELMSKENKPANDIAKTEMKKQEEKNNLENSELKLKEKKSLVDNNKTEVRIPEEKNETANTTEKHSEKGAVSEFVFADVKRTERNLKLAKAMLEERLSVPSETIYFKSDSLVLALYDNGEIDGDTVSVIINGELIIEKQGLKSAAFKKTIYLAPDETDSVLLVLYAENLGLYPPNTGLLIIKDGEDSYYVRFNADYERNAAIMFRRKLK
ncbi:MAG TPA: hypothetical protein VI548_10025 [Chitinophagaceae bacterium]|nr:hypothetical protein [Chitinophagaceae bacterium]